MSTSPLAFFFPFALVMITTITFGSYREFILETLEVDKSGQQGGGLNIGVEDEEADKIVEWRDNDHGFVL